MRKLFSGSVSKRHGLVLINGHCCAVAGNFAMGWLWLIIEVITKMLKVILKFIYIYIPTLTGKPEQQQFIMQSGVLTSVSSRQCN